LSRRTRKAVFVSIVGRLQMSHVRLIKCERGSKLADG
jgi:hypothetical protein